MASFKLPYPLTARALPDVPRHADQVDRDLAEIERQLNSLSSSRWATKVIASADPFGPTSAAGQAGADYVVETGKLHEVIAEIVAEFPASAVRVIMLEGLYQAEDTIVLPIQVWLQGMGILGTTIYAALAGGPSDFLIAGSSDGTLQGGVLSELTVVQGTETLTVAPLYIIRDCTILGTVSMDGTLASEVDFQGLVTGDGVRMTSSTITGHLALTGVAPTTILGSVFRNADAGLPEVIEITGDNKVLVGNTIVGGTGQCGIRISGNDNRAVFNDIPTIFGVTAICDTGSGNVTQDPDITDLTAADVAADPVLWTNFTGTDVQAALDDIDANWPAGGGSGSVATDTIWDTAGDLVYATGPDAAVKLPIGANGRVLTVAAGLPTWAVPTPGPTVATDTIWDTKGDLAVATGADAAVKVPVGSNGQVLVADSAQTAGVKWDTPASGGLTAIPSAKATRNSGDITLSSTSFVALDTGLDLVIPAATGDILELVFHGYIVKTSGKETVFDVASRVAGADVNYLSSGTNTRLTRGIPGWYVPASAAIQVFTGPWTYVVQAGDISGGNVTLRLYYIKAGSASSGNILAASANDVFQWSVKNLKH